MADDEELRGLLDQMDGLTRRIYDLGFRAGSIAMRDNILQVASSPMSVGQGAVMMDAAVTNSTSNFVGSSEPARRRSKVESRAPNGLVAKAIGEVLSEAPGIRVIEVADRVMRRYPEIAAKSIGNQMRRGEREGLYERSGKYSWFLRGQAPKEKASPDLEDALKSFFTETEGR